MNWLIIMQIGVHQSQGYSTSVQVPQFEVGAYSATDAEAKAKAIALPKLLLDHIQDDAGEMWSSGSCVALTHDGEPEPNTYHAWNDHPRHPAMR